MSRVVSLILETEQTSAQNLAVQVSRLADQRLSRFQYLDCLLQIATSVARLRNVNQAVIYERLNALPRNEVVAAVDALLKRPHLRNVA